MNIFVGLVFSVVVADCLIMEAKQPCNLPEQYKELIKSFRPTPKPLVVTSKTTTTLPPLTTLNSIENETTLQVNETITLLPNETTTTLKQMQVHAPFPSIPLCKETPHNDDIYGHFYCLIAFLFYLVAIVTAILFTCRAFGCAKWRFLYNYKEPPTVAEKILEDLAFLYPHLFPKGTTIEEANHILATQGLDVPDHVQRTNRSDFTRQPPHQAFV